MKDFYNNIFMNDYKTWIKKYGVLNRVQVYVRTNNLETEFYVGITEDFINRYDNFKETNEFKLKYKINRYIYLFSIPRNISKEKAELYIYSMCCFLYGEENVRGAHRTTLILKTKRKKNEILLDNHLKNLCYICKNPGHYASYCKKNLKFI
jgi:predicted GIY-YIG superfamily endonuclease